MRFNFLKMKNLFYRKQLNKNTKFLFRIHCEVGTKCEKCEKGKKYEAELKKELEKAKKSTKVDLERLSKAKDLETLELICGVEEEKYKAEKKGLLRHISGAENVPDNVEIQKSFFVNPEALKEARRTLKKDELEIFEAQLGSATSILSKLHESLSLGEHPEIIQKLQRKIDRENTYFERDYDIKDVLKSIKSPKK